MTKFRFVRSACFRANIITRLFFGDYQLDMFEPHTSNTGYDNYDNKNIPKQIRYVNGMLIEYFPDANRAIYVTLLRCEIATNNMVISTYSILIDRRRGGGRGILSTLWRASDFSQTKGVRVHGLYVGVDNDN